MRVNIEQQTYVFIISVLGGVLLSVIYDILRALKKLLKGVKALGSILDILFWVAAAFIIFCFLNMSNGGEIRGFCIIGFLIGGGLYFLILGNKLVIAICTVIETICNILISILKIIIMPFLFLYKILYIILNPLLKFMVWVLYNIKSKLRNVFICIKKDAKKSYGIIRRKK